MLMGKVAVVTGAGGRGCGRAIACRFAREGASVVIADLPRAEAGMHDTALDARDRRVRGLVRRGRLGPQERPDFLSGDPDAQRRCPIPGALRRRYRQGEGCRIGALGEATQDALRAGRLAMVTVGTVIHS